MKRSRLCNIVLLLLLSGSVFAQTDSTTVETLSIDTTQVGPIVLDSILTDTTRIDTTIVGATQLDSTEMAVQIARAPIYNATQIKLDIASPFIIPATSQWQIQHYEIAVNVRLKDRFYPTLEMGYAGGTKTQGDTLTYKGQGGFFRVGVDINPLKKHPESPHALLVGVRLGTAVHEFTHDAVRTQAGVGNSEEGLVSTSDFQVHKSGVLGDCWGEIVIGCQVEIAKGKPKANGKTPMAFYMGWMGRLKCLFTRQLEGYPATEMKAIYIPGYGKRDNIGWGLNYYLGWRF